MLKIKDGWLQRKLLLYNLSSGRRDKNFLLFHCVWTKADCALGNSLLEAYLANFDVLFDQTFVQNKRRRKFCLFVLNFLTLPLYWTKVTSE